MQFIPPLPPASTIPVIPPHSGIIVIVIVIVVIIVFIVIIVIVIIVIIIITIVIVIVIIVVIVIAGYAKGTKLRCLQEEKLRFSNLNSGILGGCSHHVSQTQSEIVKSSS